MYSLINPAGRVVTVNTLEEFNKWKKRPGFSVAPDDVIAEMAQERVKMLQEAERRAELQRNAKNGLYLMTVSPGGADGYSNSAQLIIDELGKLGLMASTDRHGQRIGMLFHNPYSVMSLSTEYRIIYTMFESDKLPDDWKDYLEAADLILVPSKWCQSVFKKAGFDTTVVPLGYNSRMFQLLDRQPKVENRDYFTFLHYNAFNIRKGFPEVLKAFVKEFKRDEPVRLILKTTLDRMPIPIYPEQYPNIEVILGKVSERELSSIMQRSDCFVFPSRGEGFGMTPLEAMATGMPAIVPNAHGITEYFNSDYMYEVNVKEKCPALYSKYKGQDVGSMVVCDVDHLAAQMRYVYEHQKEAREKGVKAAEYVKQWAFTETAKQLNGIFQEFINSPVKESPIKNVLPLERVL